MTFPENLFQGIVLIDKPQGMSSHAVVNVLRHRLSVKRIGHAGTLDPLASGLLICLVGREFTKQQDLFLKLPKTYECQFQLGLETATYDRLGKVINRADWSATRLITRNQVTAALATFIGTHAQQVPAFSAIKIHGQKLYQRARLGQTLTAAELPSRPITITKIELTDWQVDEESQLVLGTIRVECGSGTYIRSIIHDLGQKLTVGACVTELRRLSIGNIAINQAQALDAADFKFYQSPTELKLT